VYLVADGTDLLANPCNSYFGNVVISFQLVEEVDILKPEQQN
jgi:hypothetical protein